MKDDVSNGERSVDEKNLSYHLSDLPGDGVSFTIVEASERYAFRNNCMEDNVEVNLDDKN